MYTAASHNKTCKQLERKDIHILIIVIDAEDLPGSCKLHHILAGWFHSSCKHEQQASSDEVFAPIVYVLSAITFTLPRLLQFKKGSIRICFYMYTQPYLILFYLWGNNPFLHIFPMLKDWKLPLYFYSNIL